MKLAIAIILMLPLVALPGPTLAQAFTGRPPSYPPMLPKIALGNDGGHASRHIGHRHIRRLSAAFRRDRRLGVR